MVKRFLYAAAAASCLALAPPCAPAQSVYPPPADQPAAPPALSPSALDQLVAPVALYPDDLLAQMLAASTYPLEVVQAHRWISQPENAALTGGALNAAVTGQSWDPSVQALIPFPQVLAMMDDHLDWTEQLGEAFLAQPQDVMNAVQRLRHRAAQAGTLKISPEQSVVDAGGEITIASPNDQDIYVPDYNPDCAYGSWPYPAPGPVDFGPWSGVCGASDDTLGFDDATYLPFGFFLWADIDWRHHRIHIDRVRYALAQPDHDHDSDVWRHDQKYRRGAGDGNAVNARSFGASIHAEPQFRYYDGPHYDRRAPFQFGGRSGPVTLPAQAAFGAAPAPMHAGPAVRVAAPALEAHGLAAGRR